MNREDFSFSERHKKSQHAFFEALNASYEEPKTVTEAVDPYAEDKKIYMEGQMASKNLATRYMNFTENVRSALMIDALYKILSESVSDDIRRDKVSAGVMRTIVAEYVNENGYYEILNTMKTASRAMSELSGIISKHAKTILENVDSNNADTFVITPEMKDDFFNALNYSDCESITKAIHDRVSTAMQDFVTANTKDHEDINSTLKDAQEKISKVPEDDSTSLREYYEMKAKQETARIRRSPKNVLHHMVTSMSESVMKKPNEHAEFMKEGKLDMDKIVTRTALLYTFIEMLNTTRLEKVDAAFVEAVIKDLKAD